MVAMQIRKILGESKKRPKRRLKNTNLKKK